MADSKKDLEEASLDGKLETIKCTNYNVKLNTGNEKVLALIDSRSESNLISQGYTMLLSFKILENS